jgi:hypothetical protein
MFCMNFSMIAVSSSGRSVAEMLFATDDDGVHVLPARGRAVRAVERDAPQHVMLLQRSCVVAC